MFLKRNVLEAAGIIVTGQPADGDYMDMDAADVSIIDQKLISAARTRPGFTEVYAFSGPERFYSNPTRLSGASTQMLYSDGMKMAAILYRDPALSDGLLSWVRANDPAEAISQWTAEVHLGGETPVITQNVPSEFTRTH